MSFKNEYFKRRKGYPFVLVETAANEMINTNKSEIRIVTSREGNDKILAFLQDFDSSLSQIFQEVKKLTSRIFISRELKQVFAD